MASERYHRVQQVFETACRLEGHARGGFLDQACSGDPVLRSEVESLLEFDSSDDGKLGVHAAGLGWRLLLDSSSDIAQRPTPERIGPYSVVRCLGVGGMGVVYEAREDRSGRKVALKMLHLDALSDASKERFEREVRVLGRLHHPGIAQLYGAGIANIGRDSQAYFAMEMVSGRTILEHCHGIPQSERLRLFTLVCDAVEYAHMQQVVHRDLKPSNILVDEHGQPKVLDFGVARDDAKHAIETRAHTLTGQVIGTLAYMSPEQVSGKSEAVDARSDVYALGVVLYELLTGRLPIDTRSKSIADSAQAIRDEEPPRLGSLNTALRGDMETIAARALHKDAGQRFQSAAELAEDIRRHLRHEPIVARPATRMYQLRKFCRRHPGLVLGLAATLGALAAGLGATAWALSRAIDNRERAERLNQFILGAMGPGGQTSLARQRMARQVLERTVSDSGAPRTALDQVRLFESIATAYAELDLFAESVRFTAQARTIAAEQLGELSEESLRLQGLLAERMCRGSPPAGQLAEAAVVAEQAEILARRHLGASHALTQRLSAILAWTRVRCGQNDAISVLDARWKELQNDPLADSAEVAQAATRLAWAEDSRFRLPEAECLWRKSIENYSTHLSPPRVSNLLNSAFGLAHTLHKQGRLRDALGVLDEYVPRAELFARDVPDSPLVTALLAKQALIQLNLGRYEDAAAKFSRVVYLKGNRDTSADSSLWLADMGAQTNEALAHACAGRFDEADDRYEHAIEMCRKMKSDAAGRRAIELSRQRALYVGLRVGTTWQSNALRDTIRNAAAAALAAEPKACASLWGQIRYAIVPWSGAGSSATGGIRGAGMAELTSVSSPTPGLYLILTVTPQADGQRLVLTDWLWVADWDAAFFETPYLVCDPDGASKWQSRIMCSPNERRHVWGFNKCGEFDIAWGPFDRACMFGMIATTSIDLPVGSYSFSGTHRDGLNVEVDRSLIYQHWALSRTNFTFEATIGPERSTMNLQYFMYLGDPELRLSARPIGPEADSFELAVSDSMR